MPLFPLRNLPPDLWDAVKARAAQETPPGQPYKLGAIVQQLLEVYAAVGLQRVRDLLPPRDLPR